MAPSKPVITPRTVATWLFAVALAAASTTCNGDLSGPEPAALVGVAGDDQTGLVNEVLPESLAVRVDDAQGQPVSGVTVTWTAGGGGSLSQSSVTTAADGRAAVQRTLGGTAGQQTTTAAVPDLPPVVFTSTAEAGAVPQLIIATQPSSVANGGVALEQQPIVRLENGDGEPLGAGIPVTVSVTGATLSGTTTVASDGYGEVRFSDLALSGPDGSYNLVFSAPNLAAVQSAVIALSTGSTTGHLVITTQPSSAVVAGVAFAQQPVVRVEDGNGQPVGAGVDVTASVAGATLAGTATVATDGLGQAHFADLALSGPDGSYNLTFSAPNVPSIQSNSITLSTAVAEGGVWTQPFAWPIVAIHMMLLPDGRVLSIGRTGTPQVWDPANGSFTPVPAPANLFCAGHALLADGRVLVAGGHIKDGFGLPNITLFSSTGNSWSSTTPMARGRWYPTTTVMGNGDVAILAGTDQDSVNVTVPEVWSNGSLRQLTGAVKSLAWYPRAWVAPDGTLYEAGPAQKTFFLSLAGTGKWTAGPTRLFGGRNYGSAVMYDDGKILYAGGGLTTNTAEVIDLNAASPAWSWTSPMAFARRHHNLTVLPTGEVLATGGVAGTTFNDISTGVHAAEIWNPQSGDWTTLASNAITRGYHGSSLLLPDGRVLNAGSGEGAGAPNERNAELYSPPYLFKGARPTITSAPTSVGYGASFRILTPNAAAITRVSFIRLGAVTHAFDENQRFLRLAFTADATGLTVTAPSSSNRAPPGHYMVFILNGSDVPSVASVIQIQ
jgi:galactose oxidase-like protein/Big-like domain-containing protein